MELSFILKSIVEFTQFTQSIIDSGGCLTPKTCVLNVPRLIFVVLLLVLQTHAYIFLYYVQMFCKADC